MDGQPTQIGDGIGAGLDGLFADTVLAGARPLVLLAAVLAAVAVLWAPLWRVSRIVVTIAHEGGHAVVALLAGRGLTGIRLHPDTSGLTVSTGAARGPGLVATFLGGYPAPGLLGVGGAALVAADRSGWALWATVGLLAATLVAVRNPYGLLAVVATGGLVGSVAWWGEPTLQDGFAAALCWFLLFGGLRAVRELARGRRRVRAAWGRGAPRRSAESDADALARLTSVPAGGWTGLFWVLAAATMVGGGWLLLS